MKKNILLLIFLFYHTLNSYGQNHSNLATTLKLTIKNATGSHVKLLQFIGSSTIIVDSIILNTSDETVTLSGKPIDEELQFQLIIDTKGLQRFVLYPVLSKDASPQIFIDLKYAFDKRNYLEKFRFENSPSSVDWNNMFFYPGNWQKLRYRLETEYKGDKMTSSIKKTIDSLSLLIRDYRVQLLKTTKSVATVRVGLNLLKFENSLEDYGALLKDILARFPESQVVKDKVRWFINTKKYIPPGEEVLETASIAPNFSFQTNDGKTHSLADYRGGFVLLDFWASWCKPCRKESPYLKKAFKAYSEKGFNIVQISIDGTANAAKWKKAIADDGTGDFVHANKNPSDSLLLQYKIKAIPVNYLIDPSGKIIASNLRGDALVRKLEEIYQ